MIDTLLNIITIVLMWFSGYYYGTAVGLRKSTKQFTEHCDLYRAALKLTEDKLHELDWKMRVQE